MAGPPTFEELLSENQKYREELAQTRLLLKTTHAEIKRQGDIIEALKQRLFGTSSEKLDPLQSQLDFPDDVLGKPAASADAASAPAGDKEKGKGKTRNRRNKAETRPKNAPVIIDAILIPDEVQENPNAYKEIGEEHNDIPKSAFRFFS